MNWFSIFMQELSERGVDIRGPTLKSVFMRMVKMGLWKALGNWACR